MWQVWLIIAGLFHDICETVFPDITVSERKSMDIQLEKFFSGTTIGTDFKELQEEIAKMTIFIYITKELNLDDKNIKFLQKILSNESNSIVQFTEKLESSLLYLREGLSDNIKKLIFPRILGDKDKIKVIYSGVNSDRYKPYDSSKRDFNRIVFVGALVGHKGVDILINSFIELLKKYPDIKLDIYGSAKLWGKDEYLNQKQISSLVPQIKFHGAVSQDEIANVFKEAGICVIPSRYFDSFPLTAVEAQVSGCPVVCFDVGGIKECVQNGKSGVVINAVSIDGLTSNLDLLLSNKEKLREFSDYAAKTFYKIYNWDNTAKEFISYPENVQLLKDYFMT